MAEMKGQVFMISTLVFSMLILVLYLSTGPTIVNDPLPDTQRFFGQTMHETGEAFNHAIDENRSMENLRTEMYRYERFVHRNSMEMGLEYSSQLLIVLPGKGEASFINYSPDSRNVSLAVNGDWHNKTLEAWQSMNASFTPGNAHLEVETRSLEEDFYAAKPRFLKRGTMSNQQETWVNTVLG